MDEKKVAFADMSLENIMKNMDPYLLDGEILEIVKLKYNQLYRSHYDLNEANLCLKQLSTKLFLEQEEIKANCALETEALETLCKDLTMKCKILKKQNEETLGEAKQRFDKLRADFKALVNKSAPKEVLGEEERKMILNAEREKFKYERKLLQENLYHSQTDCIRLQKQIRELESKSKKQRNYYKHFEYAVMKSKQIFDACKSKILQLKNYIRNNKTNSQVNKECLEMSVNAILQMIKSDYEERPELCTLASELTDEMETQDKMNKRQEALDELYSGIQATRELYTTAASTSSNNNEGTPAPSPANRK